MALRPVHGLATWARLSGQGDIGLQHSLAAGLDPALVGSHTIAALASTRPGWALANASSPLCSRAISSAT